MKPSMTRTRLNVIIILFAVGALLIILAFAADTIGLDITPSFGMVQMGAFLLGLTLVTLAAYLTIYSLRPKGVSSSLQADIAIRLGATGLVFAYVTGLSDLIGIGTHINPEFDRPFVGPLQLGGVILGIIIIAIGLLLYSTSRGTRESSSMEFLVEDKRENGSQ